MDGRKLLKDVKRVLSLDMTDSVDDMSDQISRMRYLENISRVEARLLLIDALYKGQWMDGPKEKLPLNSGDEKLTSAALEKVIQWLDFYIINEISSPSEVTPNFPLREAMSKFFHIKSLMESHPTFRSMYMNMKDTVLKKETHTMPLLTMIPTRGLRPMHYYLNRAMYDDLTGFSDFPGEEIKRVAFQKDWFEKSELISFIFYIFSVRYDNNKNLHKIIHEAGRAEDKFPQLIALNKALSAL